MSARGATLLVLAALPGLLGANGLQPLDNETMAESRIGSGVISNESDTISEVEEQQRLLPDGEGPAIRPILLPDLNSDPGLTPLQQQFVDGLTNTVGEFGSPTP